MPTPPSNPGLWVMVLMGLLPPALPKCIFDQVQSRVRVVRAAQAVNEHGVTPLAPQQQLPVKQRSKQAEVAFKPIRITTWVVEESDSMSDTENGRLSMAVGQAVKMVSSLLSATSFCLRSPLPGGHLQSTSGWPGGHLQGQVSSRDVQPPSHRAALQRHLASPELELGGPLENQDEAPGGVSSHWESRVLQGSIMAAMLEEPSTVRIDPVTLAAFQDMGWYSVNLSRAQSLVWGEGEGAMFGSPLTCRNKSSSSFFCTHSGPGCHYLHRHKGACQTDLYLDGCRMYKALKTGSECQNKANAPNFAGETEAHGEIYGPDSRCFFSNLTTQNPSQLTVGRAVVGRCYRHRCTGPKEYQIRVSGADWVACPAGEAVQVRGYEGWVSCPDRRLCLHPDVSRLWDDTSTSVPSHQTTELDLNWSAPWKYPAALVICALVALTVMGLLSAVLLPQWKCSARVHPASLDHTTPACTQYA
ncbi:ciliated left-right organizer metallopeptidase [Synchiropus splendidus]|uniref:ciliated left-right organizer metallopeptidase n=1 Tax=Synchiropus splendidus TaxID=270530 RepID=UPI00237E3CC1|nr:ciliated left-right organizer metallopeptidase [Synchiropus splendidus]